MNFSIKGSDMLIPMEKLLSGCGYMHQDEYYLYERATYI